MHRLVSSLRVLGRLLWFVPLTLLILLNLAYLAYNAQHYDRVYRGVTVLGVDIGGLTPGDALSRLHEALGPHRLPDLAIASGLEHAYLPMAAVGGRLDLTQAVADAYTLGRSGVLLADVTTRVRLLCQGYDLAPAWSLDRAATELALRPIARLTTNPARRARLTVAGLTAAVEPSAEGRDVDVDSTVAAIRVAVTRALGSSGWLAEPRALRVLHGLRSGGDTLVMAPIDVELAHSQTTLPFSDLSGASAAVERVIGAPIELAWQPDGAAVTRRWLIDRATLGAWLRLSSVAGQPELRVSLDEDAVSAYIAALQREIERPAIEGRWRYDAQSATLDVLEPEQPGYALDVAEATRRVTAAALSADRVVALPVEQVAPAVTRADLEALLPLDLLGEGATQFVGSTAERQANIVTSSLAFDGLAVPADETFSFLAALGPVSRATGYADSWVIVGDRTELGAGGGVCQTATTCFRAAFWAGLPIVERHPHAYRVSWYEPPLGLDASVFEPYVDLRFTNDYDAPLLIQVVLDTQAQTVAFRFYGRSDGRQVSATDPETSNPLPAPEPVYEEDATLEPGAQVLVERAREGLDVAIVRLVQWPSGERDEYLLATRYAPWPARYRVAPGTPAND